MKDIRLESDVFSSDGAKVGTVDRIIVHPETLDVQGIVVHEGTVFTTDRIIEIGMIDRVDEDGNVILEISEEHEEQLPPLATARFTEPDRDMWNRMSEMNYMATPSAAGQFLVLSEPVDDRFAPAPDSPMQPAPSDPPPVVDRSSLPEGTVTLEEGTDVIDKGGEKIGTIEEVIYDSNRQIESIVIGKGIVFTDHVRIPGDWIDTVTEDTVTISRTAEAARQASEAS